MLAITWPGHQGEPRQFLGVPGTYGPGTSIPLSELGLTASEARRLVADTPLEVVETAGKKAAQVADEPAPEAEQEREG